MIATRFAVKEVLGAQPSPLAAVLDSVAAGGKPAGRQAPASNSEDQLDSVAEYATTDLALKVAAALQEFAETSTDDLDDGETLGNRLFSLILGTVDDNADGELSDDEQTLLTAALETAWDYLAGKGVSDEDCDLLLNSWDEDAASRVQELLASRLPDGEDAAGEDIDAFAFGDDADEAALDAVYKMKVSVRGGKKVRIKKRVSGTVRLSGKQKVAIRKMLRKSHSAVAQMRRLKSMRIRRRNGL